MSPEEGLLLFLSILGVYFLLIIILHKKGVLEKYNISLWGPALMWRTERGKKLIGRIARHKRFWVIYANAGIVVCFILMIMMLVLLLSTLPLVMEQEETIISSNPQLIIGLPGLNPIIPLWYGILGFIVALVVHEFSHGILASAQKLKVKSLGILYFIIPIGAFCEPVEEEIKKTSIKKRMRVFAAGPMANIVTAFVCVALISLLLFTAVQPAADGVGVYSTVDDMPADESGLKTGMVITSINNSSVVDVSSFKQVMENTGANQTVEISFVYGKQQFTEQVTLADKYQVAYQALLEQYGEVNTSLIADFEGKGYLGASVTTQFKQDLLFLQNPFLEFPFGFLYYIGLPIFGLLDGYSPLNAPFSDYYVVNSFLPEPAFWVVINILYWIFWINFMVATFNVLPMVPLDGGYLFRDMIGSLIKKVKRNLSDEAQEKIVGRLSTAISLFILLLVLAPILIPHIKGLF